MKEFFRLFAGKASDVAGSATAFLLAFAVIVTWAVSGPIFGFSDTWQLVINTGTTIITFLMVFLIQNTQNRDSRALHAKLDELIAHQPESDNHLLMAEDLTDDELERLKRHFRHVAESGGGAPHSGPGFDREEAAPRHRAGG